MSEEEYRLVRTPIERIERTTDKAIGVAGWKTSGNVDAMAIVWFPRSYRDGQRLSWTEQRDGMPILVTPAWLIEQKARDGWRFTKIPGSLSPARTSEPLPIRTPVRYFYDLVDDRDLGTVEGAYEALIEGAAELRNELRISEQEARARTERSPLGDRYAQAWLIIAQKIERIGPPAGYDVAPHFEAGEYFDAESEIAADVTKVPHGVPHFWRLVTAVMVAAGHREATVKYGRI